MTPPASRHAQDQDAVPPDVFAGVSRRDVEVAAHYLLRGSFASSGQLARVGAMLGRLAPRIAGPDRTDGQTWP